MCWNSEVSLNTFIFSLFVLLFIMYNNFYTKYKIKFFDNVFAYLFLLSVMLMQFVEYGIWENLGNIRLNHLLSIFGAILLLVQPIFSLMLVRNEGIRWKMVMLYSIFAIPYFLYQMSQHYFKTILSKGCHLEWKWGQYEYWTIFIWLFFVSFSFVYEKQYFYIVMGLLFLGMAAFFYYKDGSYKSIWCWSVNLIMFAYLVQILVIMPYGKN